MVSRRALLRTAGLSSLAGLTTFAGCTAIANDVPDGGSAPSERDHPPDATHRVAVADSDGPPEIPVRPAVDLADPYLTSGSPPVLRVTVDNPTADPVVVGEYRAVVFQYVASDGGAYVCMPHSERSTAGEPDRSPPDHEVTGDGCWRLASHPAVTMEYGTVEIPADGTLTAFVGLYATPGASRCAPLGDHRFEASYGYLPDGLGGDESEQERWGFSLRVEELAASD